MTKTTATQRTRQVSVFAHVCVLMFYLQHKQLHISSECENFAPVKLIGHTDADADWADKREGETREEQTAVRALY